MLLGNISFVNINIAFCRGIVVNCNKKEKLISDDIVNTENSGKV